MDTITVRASDLCDIKIGNPKRWTESSTTREWRFFPYYPGYSSEFAEQLLSSLHLTPDSVVFDPWNGGGTTTYAAHHVGYNAVGIDLNPAMVIVAKARTLSKLDVPSISNLTTSLLNQAEGRKTSDLEKDPLCVWLSPRSAGYIRAIEVGINQTLISSGSYCKLISNAALAQMPPLAAFFYVALFLTTRRLLSDFIPTNPTWTKKPHTLHNRKRPTQKTVCDTFVSEIQMLCQKINASYRPNTKGKKTISLKLGNAEQTGLESCSVDAIISSPPYCTRIDYAIATAIELAVLGLTKNEFDTLRRSLTGTSTVERMTHPVDDRWGRKCTEFLEALYKHPSKASKGYYFKNHIQYFHSLFRSLSEIARVLSEQGSCVLVIQDSRYKEIHNDVPGIVCEMACHWGLVLVRREDFPTERTMAVLNRNAKKYLSTRITTESVLCFQSASVKQEALSPKNNLEDFYGSK